MLFEDQPGLGELRVSGDLSTGERYGPEWTDGRGFGAFDLQKRERSLKDQGG